MLISKSKGSHDMFKFQTMKEYFLTVNCTKQSFEARIVALSSVPLCPRYLIRNTVSVSAELYGSVLAVFTLIMSETISMTSAIATCMSTSHCDQQLAVTMASLWGTIHCNVMCFNVIFLLVQDLKPQSVSNFSLSLLSTLHLPF